MTREKRHATGAVFTSSRAAKGWEDKSGGSFSALRVAENAGKLACSGVMRKLDVSRLKFLIWWNWLIYIMRENSINFFFIIFK